MRGDRKEVMREVGLEVSASLPLSELCAVCQGATVVAIWQVSGEDLHLTATRLPPLPDRQEKLLGLCPPYSTWTIHPCNSLECSSA